MGVEIVLRLGLVAVLIEAIAGAIKEAAGEKLKAKIKWEILTICLGAVLCPLAKLNLFAALDMPLVVPYVDGLGALLGKVLTGVIVSRGADYLMALWGRVNGYHAEAQMKGAERNDNGNGKPTVV